MSFKDKPLKKIVSDKRVTIDVVHNDILENFKKNKKEYEKNIELINDYEKIDGNELTEEQLIKKNNIKSEINKYKTNELIDYYMDNGEILSEYYSNKEGNNIKKKSVNVIDIMNKKKEKSPKKDIINKYMSNIDDNIIPDVYNKNIEVCPLCYNQLILKEFDCIIMCEKCGFTEKYIINSEKTSFKDPPRETSYFAYKRINHFNEWLAQFQAKESTEIPQEVYDGILKEMKKNKLLNIQDIKYHHIREILKKLKYNKYYEHIPHIINMLNGKKAPLLTRKHEEQLRIMFKEIQTPFMQHCPDTRKNFLSYSYVLHKFCELIVLDDLLVYFPLLKSREKLQQQDKIWKDICGTLKWQFIPSI